METHHAIQRSEIVSESIPDANGDGGRNRLWADQEPRNDWRQHLPRRSPGRPAHRRPCARRDPARRRDQRNSRHTGSGFLHRSLHHRAQRRRALAGHPLSAASRQRRCGLWEVRGAQRDGLHLNGQHCRPGGRQPRRRDDHRSRTGQRGRWFHSCLPEIDGSGLPLEENPTPRPSHRRARRCSKNWSRSKTISIRPTTSATWCL